MKKRIFATIFAAAAAGFTLAACSGTADTSVNETTSEAEVTEPAVETESSTQSTQATTEETTSVTEETTEAVASSDSLVIYFDYSENMGDVSDWTPDAITSASLVGETHDGVEKNNILVIADEISKQTGADVFSVRVNETFDPDYNTMVRPEQDNQTSNRHYTFVEDIDNLADYDTVYIGMPVWWSKLPQQMKVFIEEHDFAGKKIIPFGIHRGSGFGQMIGQIKELAPEANVVDDGYTVSATTANDTVRSAVDEWLEGLE